MPRKDTHFISKLRSGIRVVATIESAAFLLYFIIVYNFYRMWFTFFQCSHALVVIFACFAVESNGLETFYSTVLAYTFVLAGDVLSSIITLMDVQEFCGSSDCFGEFILKYFVLTMLISMCLIDLVQMMISLSLKTQIYKRDFKRKKY